MSVPTTPRTPWKLLRAAGLLCLTLSLNACARSTAVTDTACVVFEAPSWSSRDTEETQRWMEAYAVRWERLCVKE